MAHILEKQALELSPYGQKCYLSCNLGATIEEAKMPMIHDLLGRRKPHSPVIGVVADRVRSPSVREG